MKLNIPALLEHCKATFKRPFDMNELLKNFLEGLLLVVPVVVTIYVVVFVFEAVDGWLNLPIPGVGFVLTVAMIVLIGRLTSNVFVQGLVRRVQTLLTRTPFVNMLYTSLKDLIEAFVGGKRPFGQPVVVSLMPGGQAEAVGFVTRQSLEFLDRQDHVAVYFPQSYNFAGHLLVVPRERVRPLSVDSADVMAFIVSGGVSGGGGLRQR